MRHEQEGPESGHFVFVSIISSFRDLYLAHIQTAVATLDIRFLKTEALQRTLLQRNRPIHQYDKIRAASQYFALSFGAALLMGKEGKLVTQFFQKTRDLISETFDETHPALISVLFGMNIFLRNVVNDPVRADYFLCQAEQVALRLQTLDNQVYIRLIAIQGALAQSRSAFETRFVQMQQLPIATPQMVGPRSFQLSTWVLRGDFVIKTIAAVFMFLVWKLRDLKTGIADIIKAQKRRCDIRTESAMEAMLEDVDMVVLELEQLCYNTQDAVTILYAKSKLATLYGAKLVFYALLGRYTESRAFAIKLSCHIQQIDINRTAVTISPAISWLVDGLYAFGELENLRKIANVLRSFNLHWPHSLYNFQRATTLLQEKGSCTVLD
eukprot:TRINITY_DN11772_c0_g1_i1.p1 TRINITY_DN11772_c0_g1~~TRINITY_DN11772_c0_g1_i1.p1  ORF type:complete len:410 (-),score=32.62 TRINITY_DN11772_c0_g1_i1:23-1168(-)